MNDPTLRTELDTMMNAFDDHPEHPDVEWGHYKQITELQRQRLYDELSKPHNVPGNPACDVNELMYDILS